MLSDRKSGPIVCMFEAHAWWRRPMQHSHHGGQVCVCRSISCLKPVQIVMGGPSLCATVCQTVSFYSQFVRQFTISHFSA